MRKLVVLTGWVPNKDSQGDNGGERSMLYVGSGEGQVVSIS